MEEGLEEHLELVELVVLVEVELMVETLGVVELQIKDLLEVVEMENLLIMVEVEEELVK